MPAVFLRVVVVLATTKDCNFNAAVAASPERVCKSKFTPCKASWYLAQADVAVSVEFNILASSGFCFFNSDKTD